MANPVFLLTFGNNTINPLPALEKECIGMRDAIDPLAHDGTIEATWDQLADAVKIVNFLHQYLDRLVLFHYSGHADDRILETDDGPVFAIGMAMLFKQATAIHCVVLNGCSTRGQVELLLDAGVPVVIASRTEVDDEKSAKFSTTFYEELKSGKNLSEAFEIALAAYTALKGPYEVHRGVYKDFGNLNKNEPVWGIFHQKAEYAEWSYADLTDTSDYKPNIKLIDKLTDSLIAPPASKLEEYQQTRKLGGTVFRGNLVNEIFLMCPYPIFDQLRLLLQPLDHDNERYGKAGLDLLQRIAVTYATTVRMITLVMMARLWEVTLLPQNGKKIKLPDSLKADLKKYLYEQDRIKFESLELVQKIQDFFDDQQLNYFVDDLIKMRELLMKGTKFYDACNYLEILCINTRNWMQENSTKKLYLDSAFFKLEYEKAEESLCDFFEQLGFISKYRLLSFYDIKLALMRTENKLSYLNYFIELNGSERNGMGAQVLDYHFDPASVTLVRNFQKVEYLNLGPFIIDKNTYIIKDTKLRKSPFDLLFFDYIDQDGAITFRSVYNPEDDMLRSKIDSDAAKEFKPIYDQMNAFINALS